MRPVIRRVSNPPNPWASAEIEWLGPAPAQRLEVFEEQARSILSHNESPDIDFDWSLNPYRGCTHACAYCYARPSHEFLGWGAGSDFDRRIVVKTNAVELLRREITRRSWKGEAIAFSGVTDCYQPIERHYELTKRCLEVCVERRNPVQIVTKGCLIERDLELLKRLPRLRVHMSIAFDDDNAGRSLEPFVPRASRRFETLRQLADAGLEVGVIVAPVVPGLNDHDLPSLLERAAQGRRALCFDHDAEATGERPQRLCRAPGRTLPAPRRARLVGDSASSTRCERRQPLWASLRRARTALGAR